MQTKRHVAPFVVMALLFFATFARAETLHVPKQYATIQACIDAAGTNSVVHIPPNNYRLNATIKVAITQDYLTINGYGCRLDGFMDGPIIEISDLTTENDKIRYFVMNGVTLNGS